MLELPHELLLLLLLELVEPRLLELLEPLPRDPPLLLLLLLEPPLTSLRTLPSFPPAHATVGASAIASASARPIAIHRTDPTTPTIVDPA